MPIRWIAVALLTLLATALIAGVLGVGAVQRRIIAAPHINLTMGSFTLRAFATHTPNCRIPSTQPGNSFCSTNSIYSTDEYYVVWLMKQSRLALVRLRDDGR